MINIALAPNLRAKELRKAIKLLFSPLKWRRGPSIDLLEKDFAKYFGEQKSWSVSSGRAALYLILKSLNLREDDEVIIQAFTCMVVVNAIRFNNLIPVYADIDDENYNLTLESIKEKLSPKSKVVVVQHTFGIPCPEIEKIKEYCHKQRLIMIEDCAHAMGATHEGQKVGTFGDFSFFSLGRSKVISAVSGGMVLCRNHKYLSRFEHHYSELKFPSIFVIKQNLLHLPISALAKKTFFTFKLGRVIMLLAQKFMLINLEVTPLEKRGLKPKRPAQRLPNAMAELALSQFKDLDALNHKRRFSSLYYFEKLSDKRAMKELVMPDPAKLAGAIFLRYPIRAENPAQILQKAKSANMILGDWYATPIAPPSIDNTKTLYHEHDCPVAERVCAGIINLPTNHDIDKSEMDKIIKLIKNEH